MEYAPFYCEENIYRLLGPGSTGVVVLVSNPSRTVALAAQRAGGASGIVVWDYHVVYLDGALVYDPDSRLGCPSDAPSYLDATFPPLPPAIASRYAPRFSLLGAPRYLERFSSDRSHMRDSNGRYHQPPPAWPPVYRVATGNTLFGLVDGTDPAVERVLGLEELRSLVRGGSACYPAGDRRPAGDPVTGKEDA